jgi:hypothetical protein
LNPGMRVVMATYRGLLGGWLIAATVPLLADFHPGATGVADGLWDPFRFGLAGIELLGAVLFAFEATVVAGLLLLLCSFTAAALIHIHYQVPRWLALYALVALALWYATQRATRAVALGTGAGRRLRGNLRR